MRSVLRIIRELPYQFCLGSREVLLGYQLSLTWGGGGNNQGVISCQLCKPSAQGISLFVGGANATYAFRSYTNAGVFALNTAP